MTLLRVSTRCRSMGGNWPFLCSLISSGLVSVSLSLRGSGFSNLLLPMFCVWVGHWLCLKYLCWSRHCLEMQQMRWKNLELLRSYPLYVSYSLSILCTSQRAADSFHDGCPWFLSSCVVVWGLGLEIYGQELMWI